MKQLISIVILVFVYCHIASAQTNEKETISPKPNVKLLAQFKDTDNEWYKLAAELVEQELFNSPSVIGLIRVKNDNDRNLARRLSLLRKGMAFRAVDSSRVNFLIVDKQEHDTDVLVASNCLEMPKCEDCIVIRAIDIGKITISSKPKTITKRRKKK